MKCRFVYLVHSLLQIVVLACIAYLLLPPTKQRPTAMQPATGKIIDTLAIVNGDTLFQYANEGGH